MSSMQTTWDDKYRLGLPALTKPDPFFCSTYNNYIRGRYPDGGTALDLAAGPGRHTLLLTQLGWKVTAVDISPVAMRMLEDQASLLNKNIETITADLSDYRMPQNQFDVIILYYHFDREIFHRIYDSLKPGGYLIGKLAVNWSDTLQIGTSAARPLQKNEFLSLVRRFTTIEHIERPAGNRGVVEYLGRKNGIHYQQSKTNLQNTGCISEAVNIQV